MREYEKLDDQNPFFKYRHYVFTKPGDDILRWLVMALYNRNVYFYLQELNKLEPRDFAVAMKMIEWCRLYGNRDCELDGLVQCIHDSGDFNFRSCVHSAVGYDPVL